MITLLYLAICFFAVSVWLDYKLLVICMAFDIMIEGGEPFLRSDIWDVLRYMKGKFKLGISTNGILIGEAEAKELSEIVDYVQVSIDGAVQSTNDTIRGEESFNSVSYF